MLLKIQNVGDKNKKPKKKIEDHHPPHTPPISQTILPLLSWSGPPSALSIGKGGSQGMGGPGPTLGPPSPLPGWVGCQVYLCTSCTLINLCKSPPRPPCFCAFAHSPSVPSKWIRQGPPPLESAGCPILGTLTSSQPAPSSLPISVSWLWPGARGGEGPATQREARSPPTP